MPVLRYESEETLQDFEAFKDRVKNATDLVEPLGERWGINPHQNPRFSFFPQQRKLMGSSAQISSGVCRCGSQEQVPEEGSGRFQRVLWCAAVGSAGGFRKVPESSGVFWCRFRRRVPEGSGEFRREASSGRFLKVPAYAGVGSGGRFRKVPESSGVCWCRFWRQCRSGSGGQFRKAPEDFGGFRCMLA